MVNISLQRIAVGNDSENFVASHSYLSPRLRRKFSSAYKTCHHKPVDGSNFANVDTKPIVAGAGRY
jgi:hypothetical protein